MTDESPTAHRRTREQMADQALSWARPDRSFFAAGACHILAWEFVKSPAGRDFRAMGLRRVGEPHTFHVFATDGALALDFAGLRARSKMLTVIADAVAAECPGTAIEELELPANLEGFCAAHRHRLPGQFSGDVQARARRYLRQSLGLRVA